MWDSPMQILTFVVAIGLIAIACEIAYFRMESIRLTRKQNELLAEHLKLMRPLSIQIDSMYWQQKLREGRLSPGTDADRDAFAASLQFRERHPEFDPEDAPLLDHLMLGKKWTLENLESLWAYLKECAPGLLRTGKP